VNASVQVRTAEDADLPALRRIAAECLDRERVDAAGVVDLLHFRPGVSPFLRLAATWAGEVAGFCYAAAADGAEQIGSIDAIGVTAGRQRRGIGTALVAEATRRLGAAGCQAVRTGGSTWYYAWPGIDVEYAAALSLAEHCGFRPEFDAHNMDVDLVAWAGRRSGPIRAPEPRGRPQLRRGRADDIAAVRALVGEHFPVAWEHEMRLTLSRPRPTAFVAERAGRLVGFAGYAVYRPDLFGPVGTVPDERGSGTGAALLAACLDDMAASGLAVAQISWVGPAEFYERAVGARAGRAFVILSKSLEPGTVVPEQRG
jgi:predicted N-acetyltransferase YhbS